jgi:acyl carrier protein
LQSSQRRRTIKKRLLILSNNSAQFTAGRGVGLHYPGRCGHAPDRSLRNAMSVMRELCNDLIYVTLRVRQPMEITVIQQLRQIYIQALRLHVKPEDLPDNDLLAALHIDSVMVLEILISVETAFSLEIDNASLSLNVLNSFEAFADYLQTVHATDLFVAEK